MGRLAVATLFVILLAVRGEAQPLDLVASPPVVLKHPPINDSLGNPVYCLALLDDRGSLATGAASGVFIWDGVQGKLRHTLSVDQRGVDSLAFDPEGGLLVAGGATGVIKVWDTRSWKEVRSFGTPGRAVRSLAISPNGKLLASASPLGQQGKQDKDFAIILWDLASGKTIRTLPQPPPDLGLTVLTFLPNGKGLLAGQDRSLRLWDVEQGKEMQAVEVPGLVRSLNGLALGDDSREMAIGGFDSRIRVWDTRTWKELRSWEAHHQEPPPRRGVVAVAYTPDGRYILSGGMDSQVCIWDAANGRLLLKVDARNGSSGWVTGVAMFANGTLLAATHTGGTATVWRISRR